MNTEDYLGLMRPWYGLENDGKPKPYSEAPLEAELESVDAFDFTPLPFSAELHGRAQTRSLVSFELLQKAHERELSAALLAHIHCLTHGSFEHLILEVVRAAGFAKDRPDFAQRVGRSGDGGIDGIINLDDLGLDAIYLQAKRLRPGGVVGAAAVRDFIGGLETHHASKGVFVTTGQFSQPAMVVVKQVNCRVALINGNKLADLMIRHSIGLKKIKAYMFQEVDSLWFQRAEQAQFSNAWSGVLLSAQLRYNLAMTLHLIKLCVGVSEISEMAFWVDAVKAGRDTAEHITRAFPQRASEIIPGGSLYWVIKGMIACRQPILRFEKVQTNDGIEKCKIVFEPRIIVVRPAPRRPFQGWRYLEGADAPPDLASVTKVDAKMPEKMQRELAALGLL